MSLRQKAIDDGVIVDDDYDWLNPNLDQKELPIMFHGTHIALYEDFVRKEGLNSSCAQKIFTFAERANSLVRNLLVSEQMQSALPEWFQVWKENRKHHRDAVHIAPSACVAQKYAKEGPELFLMINHHLLLQDINPTDILPPEIVRLLTPDPLLLRLRALTNDVLSERESEIDIWHYFSNVERRKLYIQNVITTRNLLHRILTKKRVPSYEEAVKIQGLSCVANNASYLEEISVSDAVQISIRELLTQVRVSGVAPESIKIEDVAEKQTNQ